jgi:fermentation-respiration switch protein FrsA (DUF1100 family)
MTRTQLMELTPARRHFIAEGVVVEERLHDPLAIVEGAFQRDVVDMGSTHRGHLAALHVRHTAMGVKDVDRGVAAVAEGLDGGPARIARGGADDGGAAARAFQ